MTPNEFKSAYGEEWARFTGSPLYQALISVLEEEHPLKKAAEQPTDHRLHAACVYLNEAIGHDNVLKLIKGLIVARKEQHEPENDYTQPPV